MYVCWIKGKKYLILRLNHRSLLQNRPMKETLLCKRDLYTHMYIYCTSHVRMLDKGQKVKRPYITIKSYDVRPKIALAKLVTEYNVADFPFDVKKMQPSATHCTTLQHTAPHCNTLHHTATHCNTHYNTWQHTATHCNTLQHTATYAATQ